MQVMALNIIKSSGSQAYVTSHSTQSPVIEKSFRTALEEVKSKKCSILVYHRFKKPAAHEENCLLPAQIIIILLNHHIILSFHIKAMQ